MQIGSKFSIAIHILLFVHVITTKKVTSDLISTSCKINPAIIRKIMSLLRNAGIIEITLGTGGIKLIRNPEEISLRDIYLSIDPVKDGQLFKTHKNSEPQCPVGGNIVSILTPYFSSAQIAMEEYLAKYTLQNIIDDFYELTKNK
ncbi:MAG: Rrf2 family transcriptional regulator [Fusobacteriaceae bacterium]|nr:Rrf2 family transcriptional regulator [Fusobacteriaceae bacterium]